MTNPGSASGSSSAHAKKRRPGNSHTAVSQAAAVPITPVAAPTVTTSNRVLRSTRGST